MLCLLSSRLHYSQCMMPSNPTDSAYWFKVWPAARIIWPFSGAGRLQMYQSKCLRPCQCQLSKPWDEYWVYLKTNKKMPQGTALLLEPTNQCFQTADFPSLKYNLFLWSRSPTHPHPGNRLLECAVLTQRRDSSFLPSSTRLFCVCLCGEGVTAVVSQGQSSQSQRSWILHARD